MEKKCGKCGSLLKDGHAFCTKCGAVVGMSDARREDDPSPNMAATMIGQKLPVPPPRRERSPVVRSHEGGAAARPQHASSTPLERPARRGNTLLYIVLGFTAVFIIGGLLFFLLVVVID